MAGTTPYKYGTSELATLSAPFVGLISVETLWTCGMEGMSRICQSNKLVMVCYVGDMHCWLTRLVGYVVD